MQNAHNNHKSKCSLRTAMKAVTIALLGCFGYNVFWRLLSELQKLDPKSITGYDIVGRPEIQLPFECIRVRDDADLGRRLRAQKPKIALIETPGDCHLEHIRLAFECGAELIICEKPIGESLSEAAQVLRVCEQARSNQRLHILDHYANVEWVRVLRENARRWLGRIQSIDVVLLESQGIPENQIRSHKDGVGGFLHHTPAIAAQFVDVQTLNVEAGVRAKHPSAPVADSYRGAVFSTPGRPRVTIRGCVAKYMNKETRKIVVTGTDGIAIIDRSTHELYVACEDGSTLTLHMTKDTGYRGLAETLAGGEPCMSLLTVDQAVDCLRLVEEANDQATVLSKYPDASEPMFGERKRRAA